MPWLKGAKVANEWQPMSAATCTGPISRRSSFMAENTGRSGQPVQKVGGRGGSGRAERLVDLGPLRLDAWRSTASSGGHGAPVARQERGQPLADDQRRVFAGHRQHVLAVQPGLQVGLAQDLADRLLDEVGRALLDDEHGLLAGAEAR